MKRYGIPFLSKNFGAHLILWPDDPRRRTDFWPGTGLWRSWGGLTEGRGVQSLLQDISKRSG